MNVKDTNLTNGNDGLDRLSSIEKLAFSNAVLTVGGGEFRVNTTTNGNQNSPDVTGLNDGGYVVTWGSNVAAGGDGDGYGVYAQRYDAFGNATGGEFQINTTTFSNQGGAAVTALNDGGFLVTWTSDGQDGAGGGIYAQRYDASGSAAGSEFQVNSTIAGDQFLPDVTALNNGGF